MNEEQQAASDARCAAGYYDTLRECGIDQVVAVELAVAYASHLLTNRGTLAAQAKPPDPWTDGWLFKYDDVDD